jgi:hypothetical protein
MDTTFHLSKPAEPGLFLTMTLLTLSKKAISRDTLGTPTRARPMCYITRQLTLTWRGWAYGSRCQEQQTALSFWCLIRLPLPLKLHLPFHLVLPGT